MNQPQQSNRDLSPLCQLSKVAPHHLTPSVTPILSEERQIRTLERSVPLPVSTSHPPFTRHQSLMHFCSPPPTPSRDSYQSVCMLKLLWVHRGSWGLSQILHCTACLKEDSTVKAPTPDPPRPLLCIISFLPSRGEKNGPSKRSSESSGPAERSPLVQDGRVLCALAQTHIAGDDLR